MKLPVFFTRSCFFFGAALCLSCGDQPQVRIDIDPAWSPRGIVGGVETGYEQWRGVLGLYHEPSGSLCTGTLIAPRIVLTAAHCVYYNGKQGPVFDARSNPQDLYVLGGADLRGSSQIFYGVAEQILGHPLWTGDVSASGDSVDLAIVLLKKPILSVPYYNVRQSPEVEVGEAGIIVGYGVSAWNDTASAGVHRMGDTKILTIRKDMIEFGDPAGTCSGDSGGPLLAEQGDHWVLSGVASYVTNYCEPAYGHWNTSTVYHRAWIEETVKELTGSGLDDSDTETESETETSVEFMTSEETDSETSSSDTASATSTLEEVDTASTDELECPWNTGYPCACAAQTGSCADGSACVRWSDTEFGVCAKSCGGNFQDPTCSLDGYGISDYGGALCVLRLDPLAQNPDRCLVLCSYKGQSSSCPQDLVCRDLLSNGIGLCVPPSTGSLDTGEPRDTESEEDDHEGGDEDTERDYVVMSDSEGCGCSAPGMSPSVLTPLALLVSLARL